MVRKECKVNSAIRADMDPSTSANLFQEASFPPAKEACVTPVLSLEAQVHTLREHTGTVRVRKVIHEMAESVSAAGYREVVETTRVPVNRVVQSVKAPWHQGDVLVIPVYEERLVRQLVLLEEIQIAHRREALQDGATASPRLEEVFVERLDPDTGEWIPELH